MIVEYIRYKIASEQQTAFIEAYRQAVKQLAASTYCLGFELSHCEEESERFILRIEWTSTADHLQRFRNSQEFRSFLPLIKPYFENIEEMQHYHVTDVVSENRKSA